MWEARLTSELGVFTSMNIEENILASFKKKNKPKSDLYKENINI